MKWCYLFLFILLYTSCDQKLNKTESSDPATGQVEIKYAEGFDILITADGYILEVTRPFPESRDILRYHFSRNPVNSSQTQIPIERLVCTSTTHIPMLVSVGPCL